MDKGKSFDTIRARIKENFVLSQDKIYPEKNRLDILVSRQRTPAILFFCKEQLGFIHLMHVGIVDWIEDGVLELVFMLWSPTEKKRIYIRTRVNRTNPVMENMDMIWPQMNTYEREFKEMYGIDFKGLVAADEFLLEDWDGPPPMRRDFDTQAYAEEAFYTRPGREDAQDVREAIIKRSQEEIPDFAKKYSRE